MSRTITESDDEAFGQLPAKKRRPPWLERDVQLPFSKLTGDEFEILCFLLLRAKHPNDRIYYYGKTSDMGRDIIQRSENGHVRLIQCKNFSAKAGPSKIAGEMAKVYCNVYSGKIPEKPNEVVFFVANDVSAQAQDLIEFQEKWLKIAALELNKFLKAEPSDELKEFAREWWPFGDRQAGLAITEDVKVHNPGLIDTFFTIRKVIDASRADVRQDVHEEVHAALKLYLPTITTGLSRDEIRSHFAIASKPLLNWPRTLGNSRWIERPEIDTLLHHIESTPHYDCVLLGEAGSGKSALLSHLARRLKASGVACLGIKADTLDVKVDSLGKLAERLQLPATVAECVAAVAREEKVVVLLDQLDALADLVDLRSERLNVLLNLIHQLANTPNVYVIASSRTFEFGHDSRFRTIDAVEMHLTLPEWTNVSEILKQFDINGTNWPESFRSILRIPQNLKVFVEHLAGRSEQKVFESYQQMLEELWYQKVGRSPEAGPKTTLLAVVSVEMSDREVLWLPLARFDNYRALIDQLVADGICKLSENRLQFGFQHQTLFSHARARAFVQGEVGLCDFVVQREHALFVRPTLWTTLGYLREASRDTYTIQMGRLCSEPRRMHIQHLLLDFLGRLHDPDDFEEAWLVKWLDDDEFKRRAILSISSSDGWFRRLKDSHISELMLDPRGTEWQLVGLLSCAMNHSPEATVALLQENWLEDLERDQFTFRVFTGFTQWSVETVAMVCRIIERTPIREVFVTDIAANVSAYQPELAPRILATEFRKQLRELQSSTDPPEEVLPHDATLSERIATQWSYNRKDRFRKLLDCDSGRFEMSAIAEAAPLSFLNEMWPLFTEALAPTLEEQHHIINRFLSSRHLFYDFDRDSGAQNPLFEAIRIALRELGNNNPREFEVFVRQEWVSDAMLVQRLLCRSLIDLTDAPLILAFEFLTGDARRLFIGDHDEDHGDSRMLIAKIAPHISVERLHQLEQCIEKWSQYQREIPGEDVETRRARRMWDRESRLLLRLAIPKYLLSEKSTASLEAELVALPTVEARLDRVEPQVDFTVSPMSAEQMAKAADSHILKLFDELTDSTEWHPRRTLDGGTIEASLALGELAKKYPERGAALARQLRSTDQQIAASHVIQAISETDYPSTELFDLIRELVRLGFGSNDFQDSVASACGRRARSLDGLPDDICDLLKSWLDAWKFVPGEAAGNQEIRETEEERKRSVLGPSGSYSLPHGTYSIMSALAFGLIRKKPSAAKEWLDVLEAHLARPEYVRTWQVHCRELRLLSCCDQQGAVSFLNLLFAKYPAVRDSGFGVRLIVQIRKFLGEQALVELCNQLGESDWEMGLQAKGELLGGSFLTEDGFRSVDEFVEQAIAPESNVDSKLLKGIAFAAAQLWKKTTCRSRATDMFEKLSKRECQQVNLALADVFLFDKFVPNTLSKRVLQATAEHPSVIQDVSAFHFAEMLELFVSSSPDIVLKLANALLNQLESRPGDEHRRNFDLADSALTSIAITLQRMDDRRRKAGLDLFERLLGFAFSATVQTMNELDNRPLNVVSRARRRRRIN